MKQIRIFTVADPDVGLGHFFRCQSLVSAFKEKNIDTELFVESNAGEEWLTARALDTTFILLNWTGCSEAVESLMANSRLVVLDSYSIPMEIWNFFNKSTVNLAVFDDYGEKPFFKGSLINGSPGADLIDYHFMAGRVLLLGTNYQVLREPFWKRNNRTIKSNIKKIGILNGGTDHKNLTERILSIVRRSVNINIEIFALGKRSTNIGGVKCVGIVSGEKIKEFFDDLDLLISSGGQTVAEAVSCRLPTIILKTSGNQSFNIRGWLNLDTVLFGGTVYNGLWEEKLSKAVLKSQEFSTRKKMYDNMSKLNLSYSTLNVVNTLLQ